MVLRRSRTPGRGMRCSATISWRQLRIGRRQSSRAARPQKAFPARRNRYNDNTRRAYGRALGSFFVFLEDGGKERVEDMGSLDVRDHLEAAKADGLVTGAVLEHNLALSVKSARSSARARHWL
jgi:hypothetical protein